MMRKTRFAFLEPSGQLKLFGIFHAILPTPPPLQWLHEAELTLLSGNSWGTESGRSGPQESSSARRAALGAFRRAAPSFQRALQHEKHREHKRFLSPSPNTACAEGQHLNLEFMQQAPARPGSPSFPSPSFPSPSFPGSLLLRWPPCPLTKPSRVLAERCSGGLCLKAASSGLAVPLSVLSPALASPVPPFSSSSPPSQRFHPPHGSEQPSQQKLQERGGRRQLYNSLVEITDFSIFTQ